MIMLKKIILLLTAIIILPISAFASTYIGEGTITLSGSLGEEFKNMRVSITGADSGTDLEDLSADNLAVYRQTETNEDGNYSVTFGISGKSRPLDVYIGAEGMDDFLYDSVVYILSSENEKSISDIAAADSADKIKDVIDNHLYSLMCDYSLFEKLQSDSIAEFIFKNKSEIDFDSSQSAAEDINKLTAAAALSEGKISLFGEFYKLFGIDSVMDSYLKADFINAEAQNEIDFEMLGVKSIDEFSEKLVKVTADVIIKYADGYGYVQNYLTSYAQELGVDTSKLTADVCRKMLGNRYTDIGKAVNDLYDSLNSKGNGSYSAGNTGGGSGVKNVASYGSVTAPSVKQTITEPEKNKSEFTDLDGFEWAEEAISGLKDRGIINGRDAESFAPMENVKREEFTKMIIEIMNFAELDGNMPFQDVKTDDWFYPYVKKAYLAKIINGISETLFGSCRNITRQDMAVICYNAILRYGIKPADDKNILFEDRDAIADYAVKAVAALNEAGIINGDNNNKFNPSDYATRAEAAKVVYSVLNYIK